MSKKLYDVELNLEGCESGKGTLSRPFFGLAKSTMRDGMRIRVYGHKEPAVLVIPEFVGTFYLLNDEPHTVILYRGVKDQKIAGNTIRHIFMDGSPSGIEVVS